MKTLFLSGLKTKMSWWTSMMLRHSIQQNIAKKKRCLHMVSTRHQLSVKVLGLLEAKKLQSASKRNVAMFTIAVCRKWERLVLTTADHTRDSMMRKITKEQMDTPRPIFEISSRIGSGFPPSPLDIRTENAVRWLHSHIVWFLSEMLILHPSSDHWFLVVFQKTQWGWVGLVFPLGKSSLICIVESLLLSSVADNMRSVRSGCMPLKLLFNLLIRFFTATVFSIPLVLFIFTPMSNTDISQSLLRQNVRSRFVLLIPLLWLTLMFFTRPSTDSR